ncbi:MAG: energy-coupling factor transporter transmembrane protein EcfT [Micromonosporaceae bacterium]|nr:energy-coupling factor transporter transmembrane protein EcfT [Micromonosporaceae bacterium]
MSFTEPVARPDALVARRNPVAKLAAAMLISLALVSTVDPVAPAVALVAELACLPLFGIRPRVLARRAWPILLASAGALLTLTIFAADRTGAHLATIGPVEVTTGALDLAGGLALRIPAVALPGILVFATTDPTDLADALVQNLKAPARFAIGTLAAFRLLPLLADEWRLLVLARRARGIDAGRNPLAKLRRHASLAFALLVAAIRRGTQLATAMDARGFSSGRPRTAARRQHFAAADTVLLLAAAGLAALALGTSLALGTFRPV